MARRKLKKPEDQGLFARTELRPQLEDHELNEGNIIATGVGLREGELRALDWIKVQLGVKRNNVIRFAVRWFIQQYRAGNVDLKPFIRKPETPAPEHTLEIPGEED